MKQIYVFILVLLMFNAFTSTAQHYDPTSLNGEGYFKFSGKMDSAFQDILNLKLTTALVPLNEEKNKNVANLLPHYLEDYIDFLYAYIDGKRSDIYGKYLEHKEKHLTWLAQGTVSDPYTLFTQGDVHLRWGFIYALFQDYVEAAKSLKLAATFLEKNDKSFPEFAPNKRALGVLHTLAAVMPGKNQWTGSMAGLEGKPAQGLKKLEEVINHGKKNIDFEFNEETQVLYAMLLVYMGNTDATIWGNLNTAVLDYTQSPLYAYTLASKDMKTGKCKQAQTYLEKYPKSDDYHYFAYLDIMRGLCKLYKLETAAEEDFNNFLSRYRGENGVKEAYHKLAWTYLLKGDEPKYKYYMSLVEKKGEYNNVADRAAMNEMEDVKTNMIPNLTLLKARLLFDGGQYEKSFHTLEECDVQKIKNEEEKILYSYLKGRVFHEMRKTDDAIKNYTEAYEKGVKKPFYYAASAALMLGNLYEYKKDLEKAKEFYEKCLKEKPDQNQVLIHSKAKERLEEVKKVTGKK